MKILNPIIYVLVILIGFFLSILNDYLFYLSIRGLSFIAKKLDKRRKKNARSNLDFIFENKLKESEKLRIIDRCYDNFIFVILNSLRLQFMNKDKYIAKFSASNEEIINKYLTKNKRIIFLTAHYGDWEALVRYIPYKYKNLKFHAIGRLTQFSSINKLIKKSRESFGSEFLDKKGAGEKLSKIIKKENNALGLVIDQNIAPSEGLWVKMFNKDVTHTSLASILSRRHRVPLIFVCITPNDTYSEYKIHFELLSEALESRDVKQDIYNMTQLQASYTQKIILDEPREWFWFHKRFKAKYESIYK